jgi:hypothetical protein
MAVVLSAGQAHVNYRRWSQLLFHFAGVTLSFASFGCGSVAAPVLASSGVFSFLT